MDFYPDPGFWWQKTVKFNIWKIYYLYDQQMQFFIHRSLLRTSKLKEEAFSPSKDKMQHFKTWNFFTFSILLCPLGSGSRDDQNRCGSMRLRIHNTVEYNMNLTSNLCLSFSHQISGIIRKHKARLYRGYTVFIFSLTILWKRFSRIVIERVTANAKVSAVLG